MFIQFIEGAVQDREAAEKIMAKWETDVRPGAIGFLGSTGGFTADGRFAVVARFSSAADAQANGDRPEQSTWWNTFAATLDGEPAFLDCDEVTTFGEGGSDKAGFVQIITGRGTDKKRLIEIDDQMSAATEGQRPDVIGGINAWSGDTFIQTIYFTSEAEARANEAKGFEGDAKALMEEMMSLGQDVRFIDIQQPRLVSP